MAAPVEPSPHDAQRELERRALRNVRALVDKVEDHDVAHRNASRRMVGWLLAGMVAAVVLAAGAYRLLAGPGQDRVIVVAPAKAPAAGSPSR